MEIDKQLRGEALEVSVKGRLDGYWAAHLSQSLEESIQAGSHTIDLDLGLVEYVSSAGLRVLLQYYKRLRAIRGSLNIKAASENVRSVLETSGMGELLRCAVAGSAAGADALRRLETSNAVLEIEALEAGASLKALLAGDVSKMAHGAYEAGDCRAIAFPSGAFGLGLGALGKDFEDCRGRFGEFVSLGGAAAYLPTDGSNVPDYMISSGELVPEIQALCALKAEGFFSHFVRFDAKPEGRGAVAFSELLEAMPGLAGAEAFGLVLLAESSGLVGASLCRPPVGGSARDSLFGFPEIRNWLMFTAERTHEKSLCAAAGLALRDPQGKWKQILRPMGGSEGLQGHFHAAVFPYRPLPKGRLQLGEAVNSLFEAETMSGLLHLLVDDREFQGVGQSEFLRGACWLSPLSGLAVED